MKRSVVVLSLAAAVGFTALTPTPASAVGPLAAVLISYAKQALKDRLIEYAKEKLGEQLAQSMGDSPWFAALSVIAPGVVGKAAQVQSQATANAALEAAGALDRNAKPLSDAEWKELEDIVKTAARDAGAGPEDTPDVAELRAQAQASPEMVGMVRRLYEQLHAIRVEQARMRELYEKMPEAERQEVVAELVRTIETAPPEFKPQARQILQGDSLGLAPDLKRRLAAALG